jgi:hypothetical protein
VREVIPTLLLTGFVLGRWWKAVIPVGAVAWAALLISDGVDSGIGFALSAALLAAINLAVGVLVFQVIWFLVVSLPGSRRGGA